MPTITSNIMFNWFHENIEEARKEIIDAVGDLSGVHIYGNQILVAPYVRPAVTAKGFKTSMAMQREDVWQGKASMVLKLGPVAFKDVDPDTFGGILPKPGDFIFSRVQDTFQIDIKGPGSKKLRVPKPDGTGEEDARDWDGWPCRLIYPADIYGRLELPYVIV